MAKYKPGQFIKTPFGKMRVKKASNDDPCSCCAIKSFSDCLAFSAMHESKCETLIGWHCYLEKI